MKLLKSILLALPLCLLFYAAGNTAWAAHGGGFNGGGHGGMAFGGHGGEGHGSGFHGGGFHGGGFHGGYGHGSYHGFYGGVYIDPWFDGYPWGYWDGYPYAYYPPDNPYPNIAITPATPAQSGAPAWYYCSNPSGYYPYVKSCPGGWKEVAPTPPK